MRNKSDKPTNTPQGVELEYNSLRNEILKRIELRQQLISITLTLAGVFLSFGLATDLVALIYPPLAAFLAIGWVQNDRAIQNLAIYIREKLETRPIGLGYETYIQQKRERSKKLGGRRFIVMSHAGIFLFTQLMALGIELSKSVSFPFSFLKWALLVIDLVSMVVVVWVVRRARR
ncbi:MAG: hypothetical protein HXY35_12270 [Chloroflexi bacterium]|nr:hypothetical protein [Chloroflexota bacterium]